MPRMPSAWPAKPFNSLSLMHWPCVLMLLLSSIGTATAQVQASAPPNFVPPDCVTGRLSFSKDNVRMLGGVDTNRFSVDPNVHNFTLDYGEMSIDGTSVRIALARPPGTTATSEGGQARGTRLSLTRYILYGRMTARLKPITVPGVVTTFITFSDLQRQVAGETTQDEIDWEIIGKSPTIPETNVFTYKALGLERTGHGGPIANEFDPSVAHDYTIDWRRDRIIWSIDGVVQRTLLRAESRATNPRNLPAGAFWFPDLPSRIQISVWDGTSDSVKNWAGYPITWGNQDKLEAAFEYIDVQCYNNNDQPVARWSADGSNLPTSEVKPVVAALPENTKAAPPSFAASSSLGLSRPLTGNTNVVLPILVCMMTFGISMILRLG
ncbi:concanavalin A-like lectin/glucanase domain-containing protein [Entophlyctis helioformis]|nr:concanavalin A-like lectin/glucanase domain-containing protein [Entophlyctis helioformis]